MAAVREEERREAQVCHRRGAVSKRGDREELVPLGLVGRRHGRHGPAYEAVETFDEAVGLRVIWRRVNALHTVASGELVEVAVELGAVVGDHHRRDAVTTYGVVEESVSHGRRRLVFDGDHLRVVREAVDDCQDVLVSFRGGDVRGPEVNVYKEPRVVGEHRLAERRAGCERRLVGPTAHAVLDHALGRGVLTGPVKTTAQCCGKLSGANVAGVMHLECYVAL